MRRLKPIVWICHKGAVQKNNIAENAVVGRWFIEDQKWGYISKSGAVLIKPIFSAYNPVGNTRFAIVQHNNFTVELAHL